MLRGEKEVLDVRVRSTEVRMGMRISQDTGKEQWAIQGENPEMPREPLKPPERLLLGKFSYWVITTESKGSTFSMGWGAGCCKSCRSPSPEWGRECRKRKRRSRIWEKGEPREVKAANYIWIRCYSEWVTQKNEEENERTEMWGHCYKIWNDQKHSPGWTVLNFPPKNYTLCRIRVCSSKMTAFCYTSRMVFSGYLMGCVAVQPQV